MIIRNKKIKQLLLCLIRLFRLPKLYHLFPIKIQEKQQQRSKIKPINNRFKVKIRGNNKQTKLKFSIAERKYKKHKKQRKFKRK